MTIQKSLAASDPSVHAGSAHLLALATGIMLATIVVVAYACLQSDDSAERVHMILHGFADIVLVGAGGIVAGAWPRLANIRRNSGHNAALSTPRGTASA
jgi:hypothetical protein